MRADGRQGSVAKAVKEVILTPEEKETQRIATGYVRDWEPQALAVISAADRSEVKLSAVIFGFVRQATDLDAARMAFDAIETKWQVKHSTKTKGSIGKERGGEVTVKPPIPAAWRVHKSTILKLARLAPEQAAKVTDDVYFKATKDLSLNKSKLAEMYNIPALTVGVRDKRYSEADGLKLFRADMNYLGKFLKSYGPKAEADGTADSDAATLAPLPESLIQAQAKLMRTVRDAIEHGIGAEVIAVVFADATQSIETVVNAKVKADSEAALKAQDKSQKADKRKHLELNKAEAQEAQADEAQVA
jgi:hypothetical protein